MLDLRAALIHNEQRAITRSLPAMGGPAACKPGSPSERRATAEVRGWPEVGGLQQRNRGWERRRKGSRQVADGLQLEEATEEERRIARRIAYCGEKLIFRSPNCECDPTARPLLVGARRGCWSGWSRSEAWAS
jgi:hypothetical protein